MIAAFIIRGMKEFGEPTRKALIMDLAPEGKKASTFGAYYLFRDTIVSIAAFCGALLWNGSIQTRLLESLGVRQGLVDLFASFSSPATNFLTAFVFGIIGTLFFIKYGRDLKSIKTI